MNKFLFTKIPTVKKINFPQIFFKALEKCFFLPESGSVLKKKKPGSRSVKNVFEPATLLPTCFPYLPQRNSIARIGENSSKFVTKGNKKKPKSKNNFPWLLFLSLYPPFPSVVAWSRLLLFPARAWRPYFPLPPPPSPCSGCWRSSAQASLSALTVRGVVGNKTEFQRCKELPTVPVPGLQRIWLNPDRLIQFLKF